VENCTSTQQAFKTVAITGLCVPLCFRLDILQAFHDLSHPGFSRHLDILSRIFAKFRSANLRFNSEKCKFAQSEVTYLGFCLYRECHSIDPKRFEALSTYPSPKCSKDARKTLGMFNYFRKYIKNFSAITACMRHLLIKDVPFVWGAEHEAALCQLKQAVLGKVTLIYPDLNKRFVISLDASKHALGFCLAQEAEDGSLRYFDFESRARATRKYESYLSATMLELAALCQAVVEYHAFISTGYHFCF